MGGMKNHYMNMAAMALLTSKFPQSTFESKEEFESLNKDNPEDPRGRVDELQQQVFELTNPYIDLPSNVYTPSQFGGRNESKHKRSCAKNKAKRKKRKKNKKRR